MAKKKLYLTNKHKYIYKGTSNRLQEAQNIHTCVYMHIQNFYTAFDRNYNQAEEQTLIQYIIALTNSVATSFSQSHTPSLLSGLDCPMHLNNMWRI